MLSGSVTSQNSNKNIKITLQCKEAVMMCYQSFTFLSSMPFELKRVYNISFYFNKLLSL